MNTQNPFADPTDQGSVDLPDGYRWATEDEMERPDAIVVSRTCDRNGTPYEQDEADLAVPYTQAEYDAAVANPCATVFSDDYVGDLPSYARPAGEQGYVPGAWN